MKTTPSPRGRALLHQTPVGAIVIVENGTAVTHVSLAAWCNWSMWNGRKRPCCAKQPANWTNTFKVPAACLTCPFLRRERNLSNGLEGPSNHPPWGNQKLRRYRPANWTAISLPGRWACQQPEPHQHHHSLPPGHWSQWKTDRLRGRPDYQAISAGTGTGCRGSLHAVPGCGTRPMEYPCQLVKTAEKLELAYCCAASAACGGVMDFKAALGDSMPSH